MIENIKGVRNPLTIIAIFAGLAEVLGTGILPFITEANQATYIWFLMIFPATIVLMFFITLNFNSKVLYSPSDFRDEANYMRIFQPSTAAQKFHKMREEVADLSEIRSPEVHHGPQLLVTKSLSEITKFIENDPGLRYQVAEDLVIEHLTREFHVEPQRDVSLLETHGEFVFDAVFFRFSGIIVVEVKLLSATMSLSKFRIILERFKSSILGFPQHLQKNARAILAVVYDMSEEQKQKAERELQSMADDILFPIEVKMYSLVELLKELESK